MTEWPIWMYTRNRKGLEFSVGLAYKLVEEKSKSESCHYFW